MSSLQLIQESMGNGGGIFFWFEELNLQWNVHILLIFLTSFTEPICNSTLELNNIIINFYLL